MNKIFKLCLGLIGVVILMYILANSWGTEYRISKMDFIISDYIGKHESGLTETGLIQYAKEVGCEVTEQTDKIIIRYIWIWTRKEWIVPKVKVQSNQSLIGPRDGCSIIAQYLLPERCSLTTKIGG